MSRVWETIPRCTVKGKRQIDQSVIYVHPFIPKTGEKLLLRKEMRPHHMSPPQDQVKVIRSKIKTVPKGGRCRAAGWISEELKNEMASPDDTESWNPRVGTLTSCHQWASLPPDAGIWIGLQGAHWFLSFCAPQNKILQLPIYLTVFPP